MSSSHLARYVVVVIVVQALLALPGLFWPSYLDTPIGLVLVLPYFTVYILSGVGVPGLLQHNGACGWGWCAPSHLGWAAIAAAWLAGVLATAWLLSRLIAGVSKSP